MACFVKVEQGTLRGKVCTYNGTKYYSFEGIPYAKPPVGKLRFRDPQPPESWCGVRDASKPGQKCIQYHLGKMKTLKTLDGSEDCLYLNVYTPMLPNRKIQKLPVLFFVHGGINSMGRGDYYRPDYFMENNVILVTLNYRLHILGFLCLHIPEAAGNAACKDTVMALKWIKHNISCFGGDDNNVTAFGESSGAYIVSSYITSKMVDGLVHKIIAESNTSFTEGFIGDYDPTTTAKSIASFFGYETNDPKELYDLLVNLPIQDLMIAVDAIVTKIRNSDDKYQFQVYFAAFVERKHEGIEVYLHELPWVSMKMNRFKKLPMIIGFNSHEAAPFLKKDLQGNVVYSQDMQKLTSFLNLPYDSQKSQRIGRLVKEIYFQNREINDATMEEYIYLMSDFKYNRQTIAFADIYSKYGDSIYFYNFCYSGNMNLKLLRKLGLKGAMHSDILQYQFYRKNNDELSDERDKIIVKFLSKTWCNFARSGKPTWTNQQFEWPVYQHDAGLCLNIDEKISVIQSPVWSRLKILQQNAGNSSKL